MVNPSVKKHPQTYCRLKGCNERFFTTKEMKKHMNNNHNIQSDKIYNYHRTNYIPNWIIKKERANLQTK